MSEERSSSHSDIYYISHKHQVASTVVLLQKDVCRLRRASALETWLKMLKSRGTVSPNPSPAYSREQRATGRRPCEVLRVRSSSSLSRETPQHAPSSGGKKLLRHHKNGATRTRLHEEANFIWAPRSAKTMATRPPGSQ